MSGRVLSDVESGGRDDDHGVRPLYAGSPYPAWHRREGSTRYRLITTTAPTTLGEMYPATTFVFFMVGGLIAMLIRAERTVRGLQFLLNEQYNQPFTSTPRSCCCCTRHSR